MTRDTTEQPAVRPGNGSKAPAKKPAAKATVPPVPRPGSAGPGSGGARDVSTPPDGTPAVKPTTPTGSGKGTGTPPTVSPTPARTATSGTARPAEKKPAAGPRRVRLAVSRVDPWSVMKLAFLLSIAIGIMIVVASVVFWLVLDGLHVFTDVNDMVVTILGEDTTQTDILQYVELQRFVSLATIIAVVDVVLLTALSTIGAFLYNVVAALVGGVHLTLTDE